MPTPEETFVAIRSQLEAVGITVEPAGGSLQPSAPPIALFDLSQAT